MTQGENTYYYFQDGLGSVRNVVDSSEVAQNTYDHYPFGNIFAAQTENVTNPYRFTGREHEAGSLGSMHYYRNRYYMAFIGIFASRDAMWADVHRGWGYVGNAPTMLIDPFGLCDGEMALQYWMEEAKKAWERRPKPSQAAMDIRDILKGISDEMWEEDGWRTGPGHHHRGKKYKECGGYCDVMNTELTTKYLDGELPEDWEQGIAGNVWEIGKCKLERVTSGPKKKWWVHKHDAWRLDCGPDDCWILDPYKKGWGNCLPDLSLRPCSEYKKYDFQPNHARREE
jgi:RHS repeat-associated protein